MANLQETIDAIRVFIEGKVAKRIPKSDIVQSLTGSSEAKIPSQAAVKNAVNAKVDKIGIAPDLISGAAQGLMTSALPAEYTKRISAAGQTIRETGRALITKLYGKSLVWNQLLKEISSDNYSADGNFSINNGVVTIVGRVTSGGSPSYWEVKDIKNANYDFIAGHKYYIGVTCTNFNITVGAATDIRFVLGQAANQVSVSVNITGVGRFARIMTCAAPYRLSSYGYAETSASATVTPEDSFSVKDFQLVDLTLMFGAGYEPSTVEEFEALYNLHYYDYNPREIVNNTASGIKTVGFNQWDEIAEIGSIDITTGENDNTVSMRLRSKNSIRVTPLTTYYFRNPVFSSGNNIAMRYYDADGNYIGSYDADNTIVGIGNRTFKTPAGCHLVRFVLPVAYGTTYNHDICINLSNPALNGTYKPYETHTLFLNLTTLTGKLNGEGASVVIFPNGTRSAGTAYDYLVVDADGYARKAVKVMESVDLGTLNWYYNATNQWFYMANGYIFPAGQFARRGSYLQTRYQPNNISPLQLGDKEITNSNYASDTASLIIKDSAYTEAATFKAAMSGVGLIYELATQQEYVLDEPILMMYPVQNGGTEERLPEDTASAVSAPIAYDVQYTMDAKDSIGRASLTNLLEALKTAGVVGGYTMTYDSSVGAYTFVITS